MDFAQFRRDTSRHVMTIELDQGVHRSIRFNQPGSSICCYWINTWPNHLSISGDMGAFVFSRLPDMFDFFRDRSGKNQINSSYWREKLEAACTRSETRTFSERKFQEFVRDYIQDWEITVRDYEGLMAEVNDQILNCGASNKHEAIELLRDFDSSMVCRGCEFDIYDINPASWMKDSYHYRWALYAIVWSIKQYDLVKQKRTQADHDRRVLAGEI